MGRVSRLTTRCAFVSFGGRAPQGYLLLRVIRVVDTRLGRWPVLGMCCPRGQVQGHAERSTLNQEVDYEL